MRNFLLIMTVAILLRPNCLCGSQLEGTDKPLLETVAAERLCDEFMRVAHLAAMSEPLDTKAINAAVVLITEASKLTPDNEAVWRAMIEVAQMADKPELRSHAIKQLLRVTPEESTSQLARLRDAVALTNTVDQRMGVYEQLLLDGRSSKLDYRVAARLALDAALLQRQIGDIEQFARWLAESVALDPSNPEAMSLAAGFFGDETADVLRRAELLAATVLSNIRDITIQVTLAEFLMAYGDYKDARALYEIVMGGDAGTAGAISDGLLADIVLSQWADGDPIAALDTILTRQISVDKIFRKQTRSQQPRLTPLELARFHAPLVPKLATVRAAIYAEQGDKMKAAIALDDAADSFKGLIQIYQTQGEAAARQVSKLFMQAAWISVWIGADADAARSIIDNLEDEVVLPPEEKNRLEGWIAMLQGDLSTAETLLSEFVDDPAARAGLAKVYLLQGKTQAAANEYLNITRDQGGTLLGVWSRNQLKRIVGNDFVVRPEVEELQSFMVGVMQTINNYEFDPRPAIDLRVYPEEDVFNPYEPMIINVEIKNNTGVPLTISKHGPIQPLLLVEAFVEIPNATISQKPPIIIPIDREISIAPRMSINFQTNLRQKWVGGVFNEFPLSGATIYLRSTTNFMARKTTDRRGVDVLVYEAGRLGVQKDSDMFRLNGIRLTDTWLKEAIARADGISTIDDLISLILLTYVVGENTIIRVEVPVIPLDASQAPPPVVQGDRLELQNDATTTILTNFVGLGVNSQSLVIATMSSDPAVEPVLGMVQDPSSTITQLSWIIRFTSNTVPDEALDDPWLLRSLASEDESVRTVATWVFSWVENVAKQRLDQQLGPPIQ